MKKAKSMEHKYCGNCGSHNIYCYPDEVFCTNRFLQKKNAVVKTLWHCDDWHLNPQTCECVEEAKKKTKQ